MGEVFDRFRGGLDSSQNNFIAVLDEIDALIKDRGDGILYELTRINEALSKSKFSLIGISNDLRLKEFLDPRVFSSLSEEEMVFRPYDASELRNILLERSKLSFHEGSLSDAALSICSALAAAEHGDARRALRSYYVLQVKLLSDRAQTWLLKNMLETLRSILNTTESWKH